MIQVVSSPEAYSGCLDEVIYEISGCSADTATEVEILGRKSGNEELVLGVKVFYGATDYRVNVAGYVRDLFEEISLVQSKSGWVDGSKYVAWVRVRIEDVVSEWCPLLSGIRSVAEGDMLSAGPVERVLAVGEWDECVWRKKSASVSASLKLIGESEKECVIDLGTCDLTDDIVGISVNWDDLEEQLLAKGLSMKEFVRLIVECRGEEAVPVVLREYRLEPCLRNNLRLAWRNEVGGVDYYTFSRSVQETAVIDKIKAQTASEVHVLESRVECVRRLVSRCEPSEVMRWLVSLMAARQVWWIGSGSEKRIRVVPVDVMAEKSVLKEEGKLCRWEVEVKPLQKMLF